VLDADTLLNLEPIVQQLAKKLMLQKKQIDLNFHITEKRATLRMSVFENT